MEIQYVSVLIWISFALAAGVIEAFYFNKNQRKIKVKGKDIHFWFTLGRVIAALPIALTIASIVGPLESFLFGAIMVLVFPFFHDGAYYTTRNLLNKKVYPLSWFDQSKKTTAKFSFNIVIRTIFLIIAFLIFPY